MQEQNSKFRYVFNGKEVSKEDFQRLCGDLFIHVEDFTFSAVPFSSMSNFLDGDFKTERQVNEHFKSVLEVGKSKKCSPQCFCDGNCKKHLSVTLPMHRENIEVFIQKPSGLNNFYNPEKKNCSYTMCQERDCTHCFPKGSSTRHKVRKDNEFHKYPLTPEDAYKSEPIFKENPHMGEGIKESQVVKKAPVFTYCNVNKNAIEALAMAALYGHEKYKEYDKDWQNFSRVENGDFEYSNAQFRHALGIGDDTEEEHLVRSAWNAVARLEIYLRSKNE